MPPLTPSLKIAYGTGNCCQCTIPVLHHPTHIFTYNTYCSHYFVHQYKLGHHTTVIDIHACIIYVSDKIIVTKSASKLAD